MTVRLRIATMLATCAARQPVVAAMVRSRVAFGREFARPLATKADGGPRMSLAGKVVGPLVGAAVGAVAGSALAKPQTLWDDGVYTQADQAARFAEHKAKNNERVLSIDKFYDGSQMKGKRVLVTGANRGLGLALAKQLKADGAFVIGTCRSASPELDDLKIDQVIASVDVQKDDSMGILVKALEGKPIDILINNAGYFWEPEETLDNLNFEEEIKMIDICAVGPLRVSAAVVKAGLMGKDSKIAMITSQGGSVSWRNVQNPEGHDYGHHSERSHSCPCRTCRTAVRSRSAIALDSVICHCDHVPCGLDAIDPLTVSKAAANMMSALLAKELAAKGIAVLILHPGFNRTDMTSKYKEIWDVEGAVDVGVGAKRVLHEINVGNMKSSGKFINCEDGLQIPF